MVGLWPALYKYGIKKTRLVELDVCAVVKQAL
jgi:hypothetical protein